MTTTNKCAVCRESVAVSMAKWAMCSECIEREAAAKAREAGYATHTTVCEADGCDRAGRTEVAGRVWCAGHAKVVRAESR